MDCGEGNSGRCPDGCEVEVDDGGLCPTSHANIIALLSVCITEVTYKRLIVLPCLQSYKCVQSAYCVLYSGAFCGF